MVIAQTLSKASSESGFLRVVGLAIGIAVVIVAIRFILGKKN
ncbi:hypothetical protein [Hamadaea tsunoensis]|nr:hypothetical protein [Hamadaea tsunoensis]